MSQKTCPTCGRAFGKRPREAHWQFTERRFCSRPCIRLPREKPAEALSPRTRYRQTTQGGVKKLKHRAIMEAALGRKLAPKELVHHKDDDKLNNALDNLEVTDPVTHGRHHHLVYPLTKPCVVCGREFAPHKTKRKRAQTCGRPCLLALRKTIAERRRKA